MPRWLDSQGKEIWKRIAPQLTAMAVLSKIDQLALARYCQLFSQWLTADKFIQEHGQYFEVMDKFSTGPFPEILDYKLYPQANLVIKLSAELGKLEREFGLTPSSRTRIRSDIVDPAKQKKGKVLNKDKSRFFA